jgi:hypothetical protein
VGCAAGRTRRAPPAEPMVRRLGAGGRWIRTIGPATKKLCSGAPCGFRARLHQLGEALIPRGTKSSNPASSSGESRANLTSRSGRVFRFRRTAGSRISRVPRSRPHDSLTSSHGRAPQPSRSIRIHPQHPLRAEALRLGITVWSGFSLARNFCAMTSCSRLLGTCQVTPGPISQSRYPTTFSTG